jgi:hypothetical protein
VSSNPTKFCARAQTEFNLENDLVFPNPAWIENRETQLTCGKCPQSSPRIEFVSTGKLTQGSSPADAAAQGGKKIRILPKHASSVNEKPGRNWPTCQLLIASCPLGFYFQLANNLESSPLLIQ